MVKKLLHDMCFQRSAGSPGRKKNFFKNHFFLKQKFEIGSPDFYIHGDL